MPQHLGFLDGLRALAALWVVLFHTYLLLLQSPKIPWWLGFLGWIQHGHYAVGLFIVISGFCLTIPVARKKVFSPAPAVFFLRRAIRILPPLYVTLVLGILSQLAFSLLSKGNLLDPIGILSSVLLIQDLVPERSYPAQWLWSVDLEFKLYLFFPLLVSVLLTRGPVRLLIVSLLTGAALTLLFWRFLTGFSWALSSPWYIILFTFGILACWKCFSAAGPPKNATLGAGLCLGLLIFSALLIPANSTLYQQLLPINDLLIGGFGALSITALFSGRVPMVARFLESKPLDFLGQRSYSIYLTHLLVISNFQVLYRKQHLLQNNYIAAIFCLLIIFGVACIFYTVVERPCLNFLAKSKRA
jgi:peptidoglycan/LPS O-acetylase OafA/YrhL